MKLEAMFFDFDGVVADTETAWMNCVCEYCEDEGIPIDREQLLSYAGDGDVKMLRYVSGCGQVEEEEILAGVKARFERFEERISLRPGVREYIRFAKRRRLRLALVSNSRKGYIDRWLERLGLRDSFDCVVTRSADVPMKPAPDLYLLALRKLALEPGRIVAFEDSVMGMQAASAAGLCAVAYPNEVTKKEIDARYPLQADLGKILPEELVTKVAGFYGLEG